MTESDVIEFARLQDACGLGSRIGLLGGTFDPVHAGHLAMARAALTELGLDWVILMPAGIPSFKRDRHIASSTDRLAMLGLATANDERLVVSDRETSRGGITYTADTLARMRVDYPESATIYFIMGADSLDTFPSWHEAARIVELARLVVVRRGGALNSCSITALGEVVCGASAIVLDAIVPDVSSTDIRELLGRGQDPGDCLDPEVCEYIKSRGLYGFR